VAFVRFRVERALESGDDASPEGRDRLIDELRPVFAQLAPGAMRMELARIASSRLAVPESVFERQISGAPARVAAGSADRPSEGRTRGRQPGRHSNGARVGEPPMSGREEAERAFLSLCIAAPGEGATMLASVDVERDFSNELLRRAARRLREVDLREPMAAAEGVADLDSDAELKALLAELVVEAGRGDAKPAMLEAQRLQLELARVEREIAQARGRQSGEVSDLARRKATVKRDFDRAYARVLEQTGERE
jgi:DNA primase